MLENIIIFLKIKLIRIVFFNFLIIFTIKINLLYSNIIYEKNEIIITEFEVNEYTRLYKNFYNFELSENQILKNLVLQKNILKKLEKDNPRFINNLNNSFDSNYLKSINDIEFDFIRLIKIKNEFTLEYFDNEFDISDLKIFFDSFDKLELPISENNCLIIEKIINLKNNEEFIENFFINLKNNTKNFKIMINNKSYNVCINEKLFSDIEKTIFIKIEEKTKSRFERFIYGNEY